MINFKTNDGIFNFRVAGIMFHEDKVLIHRLEKDDFYSFPGGRLEMFEDTEKTIVREMKEELNIEIGVIRLLWINEHFFTFKENKYHEICFYYLINCEDKKLIDRGDIFYVTEGNCKFEFKWVPIKYIDNEVLYPTSIKKRLVDLPLTIERIVENNGMD